MEGVPKPEGPQEPQELRCLALSSSGKQHQGSSKVRDTRGRPGRGPGGTQRACRKGFLCTGQHQLDWERWPIRRSWSLCNSLNLASGCGFFIFPVEEQTGVGVSQRPGVPVDQDPGSTLSPPVGSTPVPQCNVAPLQSTVPSDETHHEPAASDRKPAGQSLEASRGGRSHAVRGVSHCWGPAGQLTRWGGRGPSDPSVKGQRENSQLRRLWGLCCSFSTLPSIREADQTQ